MQELKKEFQKVVARIRAERNAEQQRNCEYPKAMMTGQQQAKGTATVNCSGSSTLASAVVNHPAIVAFLSKHNATATLEAVNYGGYTQHQVRINFKQAAAAETKTELEKDLESVPFDEAHFTGRGFLSADKLAIAEAYRGKPVTVTEIRLCPYMYWCSINAQFGWGKMKDEERPIREEWQSTAGILEPSRSIPTFTEYGRKFVEFVLKWAYPQDYLEMVKGVGGSSNG